MFRSSLQKGPRSTRLSRQYHERIFRSFGLTIALIYFFRFVASFGSGQVLEPLMFIFIAGLAGISARAPDLQHYFETSSFILGLLLLAVEGILVYRSFSDFPRFFIIAPVLVLYVFAISGRAFGVLTGVAASALGILIMRFPASLSFFERLPLIFDQYTSEFLVLTILSQIMVVVIGYFFSDLTGRSLNQIKLAKIEKAKVDRHIHMTVTLGEIAHEVNNPLAILDGGVHIYEICLKTQDKERQKRILNDMLETSLRLESLLKSNIKGEYLSSQRDWR